MTDQAEQKQRELAEKLDTHHSNLSDVKHGRGNFGGARARKVAKLTNTDPVIWLKGATKKEIKERAKAVDHWCKGECHVKGQ